MEKLMESIMRYKILVAIIMLLMVGFAAFYMGQSSAASTNNETQVVKKADVNSGESVSKNDDKQNQSSEDILKKSDEKAKSTIKKMDEAIEENNKRIEEDDSYGKTVNGTDIPAPPKFEKSDVPTRKADFKN
jgi:cytoskeletal protein RodZ